MEYMSCPEAAKKWGISERRVQILCSENRIPGVSKLGYMWLIPKNAEKPFDMRKKQQNADTINKQINLTTTVSGVVASYAVKLYS